MSVRDPSSGQVIGGQLHLHLVARKDADVVLAHLPGDGGEDGVVHAFDLHPEHRARERLDNLAFDLDLLFFLRHLPHGNRARGARWGTRKNTAFAAADNGSKGKRPARRSRPSLPGGIASDALVQISHLPASWTTLPSSSSRPLLRRSLTMSQWSWLTFSPPTSGRPLPSARWTVPSIFSSKSVFFM